MPLTSVPELMDSAKQRGYAIGYFESWNVDSLQGVIDAAEMSHSPVIIGFNGGFLSQPGRCASERLTWYGALGSAAAASASVPCGFIFNECADDEWVRQAITAGFNLVMPVRADDETEAAYTRRVRAMTDYAHSHHVAVEAEVGTLPFGGDEDSGMGEMTDPERASAFVAATKVDLLAVSVRNIHMSLHGQAPLDLDRLAEIHQAVSTPLVLHGGTGIEDESLKSAIRLGVVKVNFGTVLKQRYLEALRRGLANADPNPHHLIGEGGEFDVMIAGRFAVRDVVLAKMELLGCMGHA